MKFIIKPDDTSYDSIIQAGVYKRLWRANSRQILRAFRNQTGMDFQQRVITARVGNFERSLAGYWRKPMSLAADYRSDNHKLYTMIHELAHRLLMGNNLSVHSSNETSHRWIFLFTYDVVCEALGEAMAGEYAVYESRTASNQQYNRAWDWATALPYEERQRRIRRLAKNALTRDRWHELEA